MTFEALKTIVSVFEQANSNNAAHTDIIKSCWKDDVPKSWLQKDSQLVSFDSYTV